MRLCRLRADIFRVLFVLQNALHDPVDALLLTSLQMTLETDLFEIHDFVQVILKIEKAPDFW